MVKQVTFFLIAVVGSSFISNVTEKPSEHLVRKTASVLTRLHILNPIDQIYFDSLGIPMDDYGEIDNVYIGHQYNPLTVAQYALDEYDSYLQGDSLAMIRFIACFRWLEEHTTHYPLYDILEYSFPWTRYAMTPPWRSAMAQAQAMQVYARAYNLTQDSSFLQNANKLQASFFIEVDSGGVTYKDDSTHWWFEEYADEGGTESRVLNGMMVTLLGLYDYYNLTGDTTSLLLFCRGFADLRNNIGKYEGKNVTYYSLKREVASRSYQRLHVDLLRELYDITDDPLLLEYADRWESFLREPFILRFYRHPNRLGVAILGLNILILWGALVLVFSVLLPVLSSDSRLSHK